MLTVPTALLLHTTEAGRHYDWLIGTPDHRKAPDARLWTARVEHPTGDWTALGRFGLTALPPHRREYLHYQGPISDGRGRVARVDRGRALIRGWWCGRIVLDVRLMHFRGCIEVSAIAGDAWRASVIGS